MEQEGDAQQFWSPGKLLITGEYFVLDGAAALALPTQMGQTLKVKTELASQRSFSWKAFHQGKLWLLASFDFTLGISASNSPEDAAFVQKLLRCVESLNPNAFAQPLRYSFETDLEFPSDFGLGSSSTLINNLADWAATNAYQLNEMILGGSGYDIAVAQKKVPLLYQKSPMPHSEPVVLHWPFKSDLLFIHQGKKQSSRDGIAAYRAKASDSKIMETISQISRDATTAQTLAEFSELMIQHEEIVGQFLELEPLSAGVLQDCPVFTKSLGAWGGDFLMTAKFPGYEDYFPSRGFEAIFSWDQIIA